MALSYNLGYQESISVHPTRRQNFAGKVYSNFPNIWEWVVSSSQLGKPAKQANAALGGVWVDIAGPAGDVSCFFWGLCESIDELKIWVYSYKVQT